jgi:hypothetical protein
LRNEGFGKKGIRVQGSGFIKKREKDSDNREPVAPEPRTPNPEPFLLNPEPLGS